MSASQKPTYIIVAPKYRDTSGGSIFLHRLADELVQLGERAVVWPMRWKPLPLLSDVLRRTILKQRYRMLPGTTACLARSSDLKRDAIVVYPEVVVGNPLGAQRVVRWLLYPPSLRGTSASFHRNDLFFKASDFSEDVSVSGGAQLLHLFSVHPAYSNERKAERNGTCYMLRKQANKPILHDTATDVCLDGLDHKQIAAEFNRCQRFICYDEATMYAQFAALCGCLPIVVPGYYKDRYSWAADRPIARYGVAFGLDDTEHALRTRHLLVEHLHDIERQGRASVSAFAKRTKHEFGYASP